MYGRAGGSLVNISAAGHRTPVDGAVAKVQRHASAGSLIPNPARIGAASTCSINARDGVAADLILISASEATVVTTEVERQGGTNSACNGASAGKIAVKVKIAALHIPRLWSCSSRQKHCCSCVTSRPFRKVPPASVTGPDPTDGTVAHNERSMLSVVPPL